MERYFDKFFEAQHVFFDTKIAQKIRENVGGDFCLIPFVENDFFLKSVSRAGSIAKILINLNFFQVK